MMKNCLLSIIFLVSIFTIPINAVSVHECNVSTHIDIDESNNVLLDQQLNIYNSSDKFVINKLGFDLPYNIKDMEVEIDGKRISADQVGGSIKINMNDYFIAPNASRLIKLRYIAEGLLSVNGGFNSFYLPKFDYCNSDNKYELKLPFPHSDIKYINVPSYGINDQGLIEFSYSSDIYLTWGEISPLNIKAEWQLDHGYFVPIPSSKYSKFTLTSIGSGVKYFQDDLKNEFFKLDNGLNYVGSYEGVLTQDKGVELEYEGALGFNEDLSAFNINKGATIKDIYDIVIDKYDPILRRSVSSIISVSDITARTEQDPIEYAYTFANLLEAQGFRSTIYYGLISLPISDELLWHFWVGIYDEEKGMSLYDPFLEDLLDFSSFGKITPNRYIWGNLNASNSFVPESIHNIKNSDTLAEYVEGKSEDVLGESFLVDVLLNKPKDLSQKVELIIKNNGSNVVYLSKILLNKVVDVTGDYRDIGILPNTAKVILLNDEIPLDALLNSNGALSADVEVVSSNNMVNIESNQVQLYSHIITVAFILALYLFFAGLILLLRKNFNNILLHLKSPN